MARKVGTSVILEDLFHTMPVRRKEFERNIKREFAKMVHILQAYCMVSVGVRITCTNSVGGKKRIVVATSGSKTVKSANRVAACLRMAAQALTRAKCALGEYCRRMKARLGKAVA